MDSVNLVAITFRTMLDWSKHCFTEINPKRWDDRSRMSSTTGVKRCFHGSAFLRTLLLGELGQIGLPDYKSPYEPRCVSLLVEALEPIPSPLFPSFHRASPLQRFISFLLPSLSIQTSTAIGFGLLLVCSQAQKSIANSSLPPLLKTESSVSQPATSYSGQLKESDLNSSSLGPDEGREERSPLLEQAILPSDQVQPSSPLHAVDRPLPPSQALTQVQGDPMFSTSEAVLTLAAPLQPAQQPIALKSSANSLDTAVSLSARDLLLLDPDPSTLQTTDHYKANSPIIHPPTPEAKISDFQASNSLLYTHERDSQTRDAPIFYRVGGELLDQGFKLAETNFLGAVLNETNIDGVDSPTADLNFDVRTIFAQLSPTVSQLLNTGQCQGCDLQGANLSGLNLSNADLSGANLNNGNLSGSDLSDANLSGSKLNNADFSGATLNNADFNGASASLGKFVFADLSNANLNNTDLTSADFENADLTNTTLVNAKIFYVNGMHSTLENADLSGAQLSDAKFVKANFANAKLVDANMNSVVLEDANLNAADLSNANLISADLSNANLAAANLSNANLSSANLTGANLETTNLSNANFKNAELAQTILADSDLTTLVNDQNGDQSENLFASPLRHQLLQHPTAHTLPEGVVALSVTNRVYSLSAEEAGENDTAFNLQLFGLNWGITNNLELKLSFQSPDSNGPGIVGDLIASRPGGDAFSDDEWTATLKQKIWQNSDKTLALSGVVAVSFTQDPRQNTFRVNGTSITRSGNAVVPGVRLPFTATVKRARFTVAPTIAFFPEDSAIHLFTPPIANPGSFGTTFGLVGAVSFNVVPQLTLWADAFIPFTGNNTLGRTSGRPDKEVAFNLGLRYLLNPQLAVDLFATNTIGSTGPLALETLSEKVGFGANLVFLPDIIPGNQRFRASDLKSTPFTSDGLGFLDGGVVPTNKVLFQVQGGGQGVMAALRYGITRQFDIGAYVDYVSNEVDESEQGVSGMLGLLNQARGAPFTASAAVTLSQTNTVNLNFFNNDRTRFATSGLDKTFPFIGNTASGNGNLFVGTISLPLHYQIRNRANVWFTPIVGFMQRRSTGLGGFNLGGSLNVIRDFSLLAEVGANFVGNGNTFIGDRLADRVPWNAAVRWSPPQILGVKGAHLEVYVTNRVGSSPWHQLRVRDQNEVTVGGGLSIPLF